MTERSPLAGLRLGLTYGAGLVLLSLVVAMLATPATSETTPVAAGLHPAGGQPNIAPPAVQPKHGFKLSTVVSLLPQG